MASGKRSTSPLEEAQRQGNTNSTTKDTPVVKNEESDIDVDVPMLTDEDIDTIVQDINEKGDTKPEPPSITMSSIKSEKEHPIVDEPPLCQTSAINNTEIDALQKHVEESLLFLDHDKAANSVSEKINQNIDLEPVKEIVWETSKCKSETDVSEKISDDENRSLEPSNILRSQDNVEETSIITDQALNATDIPENMKSNVQKSPKILQALEIVEETAISVEQVKNTTEAPQKDTEGAENNVSEPQTSSIQEVIEDCVLPVKQSQNETVVSDTVGENGNSLNLEQSNVVNNMDSEENSSPENIHTKVDDDQKKENVLDSPLPEQQQTFENQNEHKSLQLDNAQIETNEVTEKIDKIDANPVQLEPSIERPIQVKPSPSLDHVQKETSAKNDTSIVLQRDQQPFVDLHDQENPISMEMLKETGNKDMDSNPTKIRTNSPKIDEKVDENVQLESSEVREESIITSTDDKEMKDSDPHKNVDENDGKTEALNNKDENRAEIKPLQLESVQESVGKLLDIKQEAKVEKKDSVPAKVLPTQIKQVNMDENNISAPEKHMNGSEINKKSIDTNVDLKPVGIKQENVVAKLQEVWKTPISSDQVQKVSKAPEIRNEKLIYNANSAHSPAIQAIPKQTANLKRPNTSDVKLKNINSDSTIPVQDATKLTSPLQNNQSMPENSQSSKVSIPDDSECPSAKRSRVESTASENVEGSSTPLNQLHLKIWKVPRKETTLPAAHECSLNASNDDNDESPAPSDASVQWETAPEPANRPQSSCSSILEDTPMELDDGDQTDVHINVPEFSEWMIKHLLKKGFQDPRIIHIKPLKQANKSNRSVLRLGNIPKTFNQGDVHKLLKKYTSHAGKEIALKIAYIYLDKTSSPAFNTAYIKWKTVDKVLTIKALLLMRQANLFLEGRKLQVNYDYRSIVDWTADEKPIVIGKFVQKPPMAYKPPHERNRGQKKIANSVPFCAGAIDYNDPETYGLSKEFLASLQITPPLSNAVIVENIDNQSNEVNLQRVFNLAGIVKCFLLTREESSLKLKIEYDHELEAVQAVSMFNQQVLNGRVITVTMDKRNLTEEKLPEGFTKLGPGLGFGGKTLSGVRAVMEIRRVQYSLNKDIDRLKQMIGPFKSKVNEAWTKQMQLEKKIHQQNSITKQHESGALKENTAGQSTQNALACITTVIANSIQTNLMSLLGPQNNPQGYASQNQMAPSNVNPTWSAQNGTQNWAQVQAIAQANYAANMQVQHAYTQPNLVNMQPSLEMPNTTQPIPILPVPQPSPANIQQDYISQYPPSTIPTTQGAKVTAPVVQPPPVADVGKTKKTTRFDIPPVIPKPQNRGIIQSPVANVPIKPIPVVNPTEYALEIPLPIAKPQNRGPSKPTVNAKVAPLVVAPPLVKAPPKPAPIKINIPSLQVPGTSDSDKSKEDSPTRSQTYSKKALKRKSPADEPWLKKQIKAMRRSSKSPERTRTNSPRHDKVKDGRRSGERDYSREREKETEKDLRYLPDTSVVFKYLPPSVTTDDLKEKMREIGKILSAQVNTKGQALVKFRSSRDAETCIEMYHKAKVDGQTIEVKWLK